MNTPLVSICSITYNHAPFIRQCLDGFLMQQCNFPIEIIINDDCSTDGTTEIIREYAEKYPDKIFPIFHEENLYSQGVRGMFQKFVFPKARGKYIALCEGDDYWTDPLKLQKQVDFLESHPDYSMCFHKATIKYEGNIAPSYDWYGNLEEREYFVKEVLNPPCVPTASVMVRGKVVKNVPEHPDFHAGDIIVLATACSLGRVYCMGTAMSVYRRHEASWSFSNEVAKKMDVLGLLHYLAMMELFPKKITRVLKGRTAHHFISWIFNYSLYRDKVPNRCFFQAVKYCNFYLIWFFLKFVLRTLKRRVYHEK